MTDQGRGAPRAVLPPPPAAPVRSPPAAVAGETEARVQVPGGGPALEVRLAAPPGAVRIVVLCHPHPLYGGSMHSPVPLAIARVLSEANDAAAGRGQPGVGWARFNFRGVGASEGRYDEGRGEVDDALAVLGELRRRVPGVPITLAGHSFGSFVAFRAAAREASVDRALLVAPSPRFFDFGDLTRSSGLRELSVFVGDRDDLCSVDDARELAVRLHADLRVFEGHDHHFLKSRRAMAQAALPVIVPEVSLP